LSTARNSVGHEKSSNDACCWLFTAVSTTNANGTMNTTTDSTIETPLNATLRRGLTVRPPCG
jgi:hypothetical protein